MSSVNAVNGGVSDLLQTFSKSGSSPLPPALSSASVQSALEIASPGDLVQLSTQALQLQQAGALFGNSDNTGGSGATQDPALAVLQALANPTSSTTSSATPTKTLAQQEADTLLGSDSSSGATNSTINLIG